MTKPPTSDAAGAVLPEGWTITRRPDPPHPDYFSLHFDSPGYRTSYCAVRGDPVYEFLKALHESTPQPPPAGSVGVPEGFVLVPKVPTREMLDAGRSAVMARDCSSRKWSPRQHYEASGISMEGIPDEMLAGYHSIIPKMQGAALVYYAMLAAAPAPRELP